MFISPRCPRPSIALITVAESKLKTPFICLQGEDLREEQSPSWFNPVEAVQVMHYLQSLTSNSHRELDFSDIGIITPYRKQVNGKTTTMTMMMSDLCVKKCGLFRGLSFRSIVIWSVVLAVLSVKYSQSKFK